MRWKKNQTVMLSLLSQQQSCRKIVKAMYREQTTYWSTKEIILKLMPPLPLFEKYFLPSPLPLFEKDFVGFCLSMLPVLWLFNNRGVVYLQRSARRFGMPDPWSWSPSKCTNQHLRRSHFWCTKSRAWSGWKTIAEIPKVLD